MTTPRTTDTTARRIARHPVIFLIAMLLASPAAAISTSSTRYAVHEINFDHSNATGWGGTNAGPYKELDCRAELTAAPGTTTQATRAVPRTDGGANTFKIPLFYDGIVTVGGLNRYRWKLRLAGNTAGTYTYKVICNCSLIATASPSYCAIKPSFHSTTVVHTHTISNTTTSQMDDYTWEGKGWLTTDGARFFRYDRKDIAGNPDNRTISNGIFATGAGLGLSQQSKSEKRTIGYEEAHIDTLAAAAGQNNFNLIVFEAYRGWSDNASIVNKDAKGDPNAATNLEAYVCKTPQTCGSSLTNCGCSDKLHPFENRGSDKTRIVPAYWQSLDVRLKKLALATASGRKSITAAIKFGQNTCVGGTQGFGTSNGLPHNKYKHFLLYLIGRFGAYNVLWLGHQEADELGCHSTAYISAYLDWMHRNDPYFRLTSNHKLPHTSGAFNPYTNDDAWSTGPVSPQILGVQETDSFGSGGNLDEAGPDDTAAWDHARSASWGTNLPGLTGNPKPWVNMEYGFERRASDDDRGQADQIDLDLLEDVWGALLGRAAGIFYGSPWIKAGNRSSVDPSRFNDPGFRSYHPNLYNFFQDAGANVRYWEWNAFKKVPVGATAYTLSCKQNDSCVLNFLETNDQNLNLTATGAGNPAFAFGTTVHLRWYDVRRGCWKDTGTKSFVAGTANNFIRPSNPSGGNDRWIAILRKETPYWALPVACSEI
ncbi:MAG: hypothetical protein ACT4QB_12095 [Gammaproteobacteria bacterium]